MSERPPPPPILDLGAPPPPPPFPSGESTGARDRRRMPRWLAPLGMAGALLAKFGAKLAFLWPFLKLALPFLKSAAFMLVSVWLYSQFWGWPFAVGFVGLIFVHEMGHIVAARLCGVPTSLPYFIPFLGAVILLRDHRLDAWTEARIAIAGPVFGAAAAAACYALAGATGDGFWAALAYQGFWLNLFNLIPLSPLDGGRVVTAISRWLWVAGLILLGAYFAVSLSYRGDRGGWSSGAMILILVLLSGVPRLLRFLAHRGEDPEEARRFDVPTRRRVAMGAVYFGLAGLLYTGMDAAQTIADRAMAGGRELAATGGGIRL